MCNDCCSNAPSSTADAAFPLEALPEKALLETLKCLPFRDARAVRLTSNMLRSVFASGFSFTPV